mmetsp:Transcript_85882/g.118440  ORF Transcript_85882/g.118440 Transcript_85882/m.118440 type:complete len:85 (-) Transcript_85882:251-505(-)
MSNVTVPCLVQSAAPPWSSLYTATGTPEKLATCSDIGAQHQLITNWPETTTRCKRRKGARAADCCERQFPGHLSLSACGDGMEH